jgi:hypothetical protein
MAIAELFRIKNSNRIERKGGTENASNYTVESMRPNDVPEMAALEKSWAPWLRKSTEDFQYIAVHFPQTQKVVHSLNGNNNVAGFIIVNKIHWGGPGPKDDFTTWDQVAGGSVKNSNMKDTYKEDGNTLVLMAATVASQKRGDGLAPKLVNAVREMAQVQNIQYIISAFRPSDYGKYQLEHGPTDFTEYCAMKNNNGEPLDTWLRSVTRLGMQPIRTITNSMRVEATREEFEEYRQNYKPELWKPITEDGKTWLCGETGTWTIVGDSQNPDADAVYAVYTEHNLLGLIPLKQPPAN